MPNTLVELLQFDADKQLSAEDTRSLFTEVYATNQDQHYRETEEKIRSRGRLNMRDFRRGIGTDFIPFYNFVSKNIPKRRSSTTSQLKTDALLTGWNAAKRARDLGYENIPQLLILEGVEALATSPQMLENFVDQVHTVVSPYIADSFEQTINWHEIILEAAFEQETASETKQYLQEKSQDYAMEVAEITAVLKRVEAMPPDSKQRIIPQGYVDDLVGPEVKAQLYRRFAKKFVSDMQKEDPNEIESMVDPITTIGMYVAEEIRVSNLSGPAISDKKIREGREIVRALSDVIGHIQGLETDRPTQGAENRLEYVQSVLVFQSLDMARRQIRNLSPASQFSDDRDSRYVNRMQLHQMYFARYHADQAFQYAELLKDSS